MATLPVIFQGKQFLRTGKLFLSDGKHVLDLSEMHFRFLVDSADEESPNNATIRVYNIGSELTSSILNQYNAVALQAGYQDNNAIIFQGTVKQYRHGRENNVDSFIEIRAASDDIPYNFTIPTAVNIDKNDLKQKEILDVLTTKMSVKIPKTTMANVLRVTGLPLLRGKVMFGVPKAYIRDMATTLNSSWSIRDGELFITQQDGYIPGQIIVLNSATGLVGVPEATENGIEIRCLINPRLFIGGLVALNNGDLVDSTILNNVGFPGYKTQSFVAAKADDGQYRILTLQHEGDTRGQAWYSTMTCLKLDTSSENAPKVINK